MLRRFFCYREDSNNYLFDFVDSTFLLFLLKRTRRNVLTLHFMKFVLPILVKVFISLLFSCLLELISQVCCMNVQSIESINLRFSVWTFVLFLFFLFFFNLWSSRRHCTRIQYHIKRNVEKNKNKEMKCPRYL